jgi:phenylacetate-CoA ligase
MNLRTRFFLMRYGWFKSGATEAYKEILRHQYLSEEELAEVAWVKTKKLLYHAYNTVPWYRRRFKEIGLHPKDLTRPEHFTQVPVVKRRDLIRHYTEFISEGTVSGRLHTITTGGSTGSPVKIGTDRTGNRELQKWQMMSWWGLEPNANLASIYRKLPIDGLKKMVLSLVYWPQQRTQLDAAMLSDPDIRRFLTAFSRIAPEVVHGYAGALDAVAAFIMREGIQVPAPRVVWSTASPLSKVQEEKISKAFGAPVCDQYGCSEIYFIAASCPKNQGLHQFSDAVKMEVVDDNYHPVPKGESGRFLLTNLNEFSFPLIRYENGDRGSWKIGNCTCGIGLPLMNPVKGRISDQLSLPDGSVVAGEYLTTLFDDCTTHIRQFQIYQKKNLEITIRVVGVEKGERLIQLLETVRAQLASKISHQVPVSVEIVDAIEPIRGKLHYIYKER